jgi:hypothetical protein
MREGQRKKLIKSGIGKAEKYSNQRKYKCMFPSCTLASIKSHSQQKKNQLEAISENSEVYTKNQNLYQIFNSEKVEFSKAELLSKKNIGEASRFKGYCNTHDTSIFSPIENGNIDISNPEHNFLLLLRAMSYEYANKRDVYNRQKDILKKIGYLFSYDGKNNFEAHLCGMKVFLKKDAPYHMSKLFEIYESKNWSAINYNSFVINRNIGISSTTCFSPFRERHSEWMNQHFDEPQPIVSFSVVPTKQITTISFVWFAEINPHCIEFLKVSAEQENILKLINMYAFSESEDVCVKPSLWEKLTKREKKQIYKHMGNSDSLPDSNLIPIVLSL